MLAKLFWLWLGGGIGTICRYWLATKLYFRFQESVFPYGTLGVNLLGCFFIGLLVEILDKQGAPPHIRLFLITGLLGGFTTFSAFGLETLNLIKQGALPAAFIYMMASVGLGLLAVWGGVQLAKPA